MPKITSRLLPVLLFLAVALPTCLVFAFRVPPGQVADEPGHIARADSLASGQLAGRRGPQPQPDGTTAIVAGVMADPAYMQVATMVSPHTQVIDPSRLAWARALGWQGPRVFVGLNTIATYMPVFYLPAVAGMQVARILGAGPFDAILAGRLANVAAFLVLAGTALTVARRGRGLLFCMLAVPMTLSLAASFNQDCLIIAAVALAAALVTRGEGAANPAATTPYRLAALLLAMVIAVKPPYLPLVALLLLPLPVSWRALGQALGTPPARGPLLRRLALAGLALLPMVAWGLLVQRGLATAIPRPAYEAGLIWPGPRPAVFHGTDATAQIQVLLAAPWRVVTLVWNTLRIPRHFTGLFFESIAMLGWLDLRLPKAVYAAWTLALAVAAWLDMRLDRGGRPALCAAWGRVRWTEVALLALAAGVAVEGIFLSQNLTWTNVGWPTVDGPQGRYFLPLFPLFILALPRPPAATAGRPPRLLGLAPTAAALLTLALLPAALAAAYYPG
ncbi:DUF2142 domain-containing protein [Nitrospirillum pindoramense]|uniref:Putative membrane protein n=1 Tax=Nitrospirillum amazonense TaxID=28077 RepID=A0A560H855_9PROT|nr:DUF2142 domain-containing protein [Nitrospirillum amazonense]TWB42515.1 putative membrane protein [Nitrospirillum amazonense]